MTIVLIIVEGVSYQKKGNFSESKQEFCTGTLKMSFPIEIKDVEPELNKQLLSDFTGERKGFLQVYTSILSGKFIKQKVIFRLDRKNISCHQNTGNRGPTSITWRCARMMFGLSHIPDLVYFTISFVWYTH
jgi:hypothetical protein